MTAYLHIPGIPVVLEFADADPATVIEHLHRLRRAGAAERIFGDDDRRLVVDLAAVPHLFAEAERPAAARHILDATLTQLTG